MFKKLFKEIDKTPISAKDAKAIVDSKKSVDLEKEVEEHLGNIFASIKEIAKNGASSITYQYGYLKKDRREIIIRQLQELGYTVYDSQNAMSVGVCGTYLTIKFENA